MTSTQAGWLKVFGTAALTAATALQAVETWSVRAIVLTVLGALGTAALSAWNLYQQAPPKAPPAPPPAATVGAVLLGLTLAGAGAYGCYPRPTEPVPSCAEQPKQPWCAPPPFEAKARDGGGQ